MRYLVIVESPTKARTLSRFLGGNYKIVASMGHIRDLPKSQLGVDTDHGFTPHYIIPRDKRKNVKLLKEEAVGKEKIILATDPDREGEAIAYHVKYIIVSDGRLNVTDGKFERIVFHEITKEAITEALKNPRDIDLNLFDAQQARRVLDRLVGYKLSPLLWYKVKKGLSAGRVQSVAVRLIVEREREIEAFVPVEYWIIKAELEKDKSVFLATLIEKNGEKVQIKNKNEADKLVSQLEKANYIVREVKTSEIKKYPPPPFTTSTMQQAASNRFGFSSKQTMRLAQDLYEEGFITYHRTDSVNVSQAAIGWVRSYIKNQYGQNYLPEKPMFYKTKTKGAQEAHEAIRPTYVSKNASEIPLSEVHRKLYEMIKLRFVTSQMKEAVYQQTTVDINALDCLFRTVGTVVIFPGWRIVYGIKEGDYISEDGEVNKLPPLKINEKLSLLKLIPEQKFTQPPARFTEASLIKALEEEGIGRPSTYAPIISTIQDRGYVIKEDRRLKPTELGFLVNDFLVKYFPKIVDISFTARMEENLDRIARGEIKWVPVISEFYTPFEKEFEDVKKNAEKVEIPVVETGEKCPQCGSNLIFKTGKFGKFIACANFPECKFTKKYIEKLGVLCPKCGKGEVIVKKTKKGKFFYGCINYPECDFASWQKPSSVSTSKTSQNPGVSS